MEIDDKKCGPYMMYGVFQVSSRLDKCVYFRCFSGDAEGVERMDCYFVIRNLLGVIFNVIFFFLHGITPSLWRLISYLYLT